MGEIRQFSKVGEVVVVKEIKLNELTNLQLVCVLCLNVKIYIHGLLLWKVVDHMRVVLLDTRRCLSLTFKNKKRDYLRLVKPFTLISLTVSTSSTFETTLFHQL